MRAKSFLIQIFFFKTEPNNGFTLYTGKNNRLLGIKRQLNMMYACTI